MIRRALLAAAALAVALVPFPGVAQTTATLRVATIPIDAGAEVFYAQEMGFFKKAGLDVQIQSIPNGGAIASAVAGHAVDVGYANLVSVAVAYKKGVPFTVIAPAALYTSSAPTTACIVAKSSPLRSAKELGGKTIASDALGNIAQFGAEAWLDKSGGSSSSVRFVEMPFPEMGPALAAGRIDAGVVAEPNLTAAKSGEARVLADCFDAIGKQFMIGAWFTSRSWADAHPDLVKRFDSAIREAGAWANKNPERSGAILAKYSKIGPAVIGKMTRARYGESLDPALLQPVVDLAAKYGGLGEPFPAQSLLYAAR
jgi:NitT/TauT family transport system substrate-binding protein